MGLEWEELKRRGALKIEEHWKENLDTKAKETLEETEEEDEEADPAVKSNAGKMNGDMLKAKHLKLRLWWETTEPFIK